MLDTYKIVPMSGHKQEYTPPRTLVVELDAEKVICQSPKLVWFLTDPSGNIFSEGVEWGRGSYGSADEI